MSDKVIVQIIAGNYSGDPNTWYLNCETLHDLFQLQQNTSVLNHCAKHVFILIFSTSVPCVITAVIPSCTPLITIIIPIQFHVQLFQRSNNWYVNYYSMRITGSLI